jgi:YidC/Oxa1 family membrane protein insertase
MSVLDPVIDPVSSVLAAVVAGAHHTLTSLGAAPASGATWLFCIAAVVVLVRLALLPVVVHGVRLAHASARARPQLRDLQSRYRGRTDIESLRRLRDERRGISAEHGVPRLGCLPMLMQVPVWVALYHLLSNVAAGVPVGAMSLDLVASLGAAAILGVPLAERGYLGAGLVHLAVVAGLAAVAATLSFVTQRYLIAPNSVTDGLPEAVASAQQLLPAISAVSMLMLGGFVPVAMLVYWVCNSTWTLAQTAVVVRWFPTPGTTAAERRT